MLAETMLEWRLTLVRQGKHKLRFCRPLLLQVIGHVPQVIGVHLPHLPILIMTNIANETEAVAAAEVEGGVTEADAGGDAIGVRVTIETGDVKLEGRVPRLGRRKCLQPMQCTMTSRPCRHKQLNQAPLLVRSSL